eukprot:TRINITY_DN12873_c0_g2_i9.p2 TRINITY_DN12873_c0_g2~~TRINITY_DN12873_c0_g2_i9.p2  ORF type:complete len:117 (-),score=8.07 TRINITY_DN12873_c0_g2_i9:530-880(-)
MAVGVGAQEGVVGRADHNHAIVVFQRPPLPLAAVGADRHLTVGVGRQVAAVHAGKESTANGVDLRRLPDVSLGTEVNSVVGAEWCRVNVVYLQYPLSSPVMDVVLGHCSPDGCCYE